MGEQVILGFHLLALDVVPREQEAEVKWRFIIDIDFIRAARLRHLKAQIIIALVQRAERLLHERVDLAQCRIGIAIQIVAL